MFRFINLFRRRREEVTWEIHRLVGNSSATSFNESHQESRWANEAKRTTSQEASSPSSPPQRLHTYNTPYFLSTYCHCLYLLPSLEGTISIVVARCINNSVDTTNIGGLPKRDNHVLWHRYNIARLRHVFLYRNSLHCEYGIVSSILRHWRRETMLSVDWASKWQFVCCVQVLLVSSGWDWDWRGAAGGGGAFEVASHQGNAFWGGEGWCDVGRIGVEWRTNGRSQRSSAVPSLPMFVLRVVWLSAFFQISSLSSPCCFNISSFPIIWTALRWSFANNTTLLHFGNRGRQRS